MVGYTGKSGSLSRAAARSGTNLSRINTRATSGREAYWQEVMTTERTHEGTALGASII